MEIKESGVQYDVQTRGDPGYTREGRGQLGDLKKSEGKSYNYTRDDIGALRRKQGHLAVERGNADQHRHEEVGERKVG